MPMMLPLALALLAWPGDPPSAARPSGLELVEAIESVVQDAIARAEPSVVAIAREKAENDQTLAVKGRNPDPEPDAEPRVPNAFMQLADPTEADGMTFDYGSGVVIGEGGEILTAFHVVRGAKVLKVRAAGRQYFKAEIIAADPRTDLAVIVPRSAPDHPAPRLKPIALGDATKLRKGSFLVALGNPFNAAKKDGRASASWGILANSSRQFEAAYDEPRADIPLRNLPTLLQLDSKLNLGMSGGAVINMRGELVGLTTAVANAVGFDVQAGYAIPIDLLGRKVIETLRQGREYEHGFLGISLDKFAHTTTVKDCQPNTPAANGGLQVGDVIVQVGEIPVTDDDSLVVAINSFSAGESVRFKILRKGMEIERTIALAKRAVDGQIATNRPPAWRGLRVDYMSTLANLGFNDPAQRAFSRGGVVVSEVLTGSEAERAGLKRSQIITRVGPDNVQVHNPREFAEAVGALKGPVRLETELGAVTVK
jgi:serine protease Do